MKGLKYTHSLEKDTVQLSQTIGKHKIPRFIYHITSRDNYEKILQSRYLKLSEADNFSGSGIFMLELEKFFKPWKNVEVKNQSIIKFVGCKFLHQILNNYYWKLADRCE